MKPKLGSIRSLSVGLLLGGVVAAVPMRIHAQGPFSGPEMPASTPADMHDLSGYWELGYDDRSVPEAQLTPEAKQKMPKMRQADLISQRYCRPVGMPATMDPGRPLSIIDGKYEILITAPLNSQH